MAFDPVRDGRGQPRVRCICDVCGREGVVCADHGKGNGVAGQAAPKLQKLGWVYASKRLRCAKCAAQERVVALEGKGEARAVVAPPREPTRAQKRDIMDLLDEVYDIDAECYKRGDTDETVADVLGVMPGWVAQVREDFFGPAGCNEDMAALRESVEALLKEGAACIKDLQANGIDPLRKVLSQAKEIGVRLEKIEKAVGPRVMARVK